MLTSESAQEFTQARQQAFIEEWLNFFKGRPNDLLSFEEVKQNLRLQNSAYKGLQTIELDKIVGSTGRYRDFNRTFLPKTDQTEERWRRVDAIAHTQGFPPIEVYKVGDVYFVRDGNHRVSVARIHKADTIEAYVIEFKTPIPITKEDDLDDILLKMERAEFFNRTHLDLLRPEQDIVFTEPGRYRLLEEHIAFHKFLKEVECQCELSYEEAVNSWYAQVYMPLIELIRTSDILKDFPERTEADLYAWLVLHRAVLEAELQALGYIPDEALIEELKRERATNSFARLMGLFRNELNLQHLPLKIEREKFLTQTYLDQIKPGHGIQFTEPGCYELVKKHIVVHKYLKETEANREMGYEEAVASWYDHVYLPVIQLIRERHLSDQFPKNTEGDLYIWLLSRREALEAEQNAMGQVPNETLIQELKQESQSGPAAILNYFFQPKLDLQRIVAQQELQAH